MKQHTASCSCGQLTLVARGDPIRVSMCHCLACQRRTGSTYGVQARFRSANVEIEGSATEWVRIGDEGNACRFHFCPRCGATVYYRLGGADFIGVPVGAFADPEFPPPQRSFYEQRRHPWVGVPSGAQRED